MVNLKAYVDELPASQRPVIIQSVKSPPSATNHSYRDYSKVPPPPDYAFPTTLDDMTFAEKVYDMLSQPRYEHSISWLPHGRAFKIMVPKSFEAEVCPQYFGHSRYSSFLRDLNKHGFKHITKGEDRNCYYHELMLQGCYHLPQFMPVRPRDARRLDADPKNEPDFYSISVLFPLKEQPSGGTALPIGALASETTTATTPKAIAPSLASMWNQRFQQSLGHHQRHVAPQQAVSNDNDNNNKPAAVSSSAFNSMATTPYAPPSMLNSLMNNMTQQQQQQQSTPFAGLTPAAIQMLLGESGLGALQQQQQQPQQQQLAQFSLPFLASAFQASTAPSNNYNNNNNNNGPFTRSSPPSMEVTSSGLFTTPSTGGVGGAGNNQPHPTSAALTSLQQIVAQLGHTAGASPPPPPQQQQQQPTPDILHALSALLSSQQQQQQPKAEPSLEETITALLAQKRAW